MVNFQIIENIGWQIKIWMEIKTNFQDNNFYIFFSFTEVIIKPNK